MKRVFLAAFITLLLLILPASIALSTPDAGWNKYSGNPIMFYGPPAGWDDFSIYSTDVMFWDHNDVDASNDEFYMWYSGTSYNMNGKDIGVATSKDGMTWTKYNGNPVLRDGTFGYWDYERINAPSVLYDKQEGIWKMWYAGYAAYIGGFWIGYATSPDGINWTKFAGAENTGLVFMSSDYAENFDGYSVLSPEVLKMNSPRGKYHMWYAGNGGTISSNQIGVAFSDDGIHWRRYPDDESPQPVLPIGAPGQWDEGETVSPSILPIGSVLHMWYQGSNADKSITGIGHATSTDGGITWVKDPANPLLVGAALGDWDAERVFYPTVVQDAQGRLFMWYHARRRNMDTIPFKLGVAFWDVNFNPTATPILPPGMTPSPTPTDPSLPADVETCKQGSNACLYMPVVQRPKDTPTPKP
jgi:sucrose-6-phosphate hydrolase SacC (GH32 family)